MLSKLKILFLCTGNSCRSQMAEGWTRHLNPESVEPYSAGVAPSQLDPRAVRVMAEAGVDISGQWSKPVGDVLEIDLDYVVTVCDEASENCPVFPGKIVVRHVGFADPPRLARDASSEQEALSAYRRVRDEIRDFVETLPNSLLNEGTA